MVKVGKVEAGREDPPALVFGVIHEVPPEQSHFNPGVKQNQVGSDFERHDGGIVLCIKVTRITVKYTAEGSTPFHLSRSQAQPPIPLEFF
jgi:hypothetical protein